MREAQILGRVKFFNFLKSEKSSETSWGRAVPSSYPAEIEQLHCLVSQICYFKMFNSFGLLKLYSGSCSIIYMCMLISLALNKFFNLLN